MTALPTRLALGLVALGLTSFHAAQAQAPARAQFAQFAAHALHGFRSRWLAEGSRGAVRLASIMNTPEMHPVAGATILEPCKRLQGSIVRMSAHFHLKAPVRNADVIAQTPSKLITIRGVHNYHPRHLIEALDFVHGNRKRFPFHALVDGKYALYTRPQDSFIEAGKGGGIGWALCDDIKNAVLGEEGEDAQGRDADVVDVLAARRHDVTLVHLVAGVAGPRTVGVLTRD